MREWVITAALPFATDALVAYLGRRAVVGVEQFRGHRYQRVLVIDDETVELEVDLSHTAVSGVVCVRATCSAGLVDAINERVRWLIDPLWEPAPAARVLETDPRLEPLVRRRPGLRVPGSMAPFEVAVRAIVGQQISVAAATTLTARISREFGHPVSSAFLGLERTFPTPQILSSAPLEGCGLPRTRASAIRDLAAAIAAGRVVLHRPSSDEVVVAVQAIRGIGPWTAQYVALRGLGGHDCLPVADLGLRTVLSSVPGTPLSPRELARRSESWRPYRGVAAVHLWTSILLDASPATSAT